MTIMKLQTGDKLYETRFQGELIPGARNAFMQAWEALKRVLLRAWHVILSWLIR